MCIDAGVSGSPRQVLVFPVWYVLVCFRVAVFLGEAEVDDVHEVTLLAETHQEVVRLYVTVYEVLGVYVLDAADLQ